MVDEIEFATKEDLAIIKADPHLTKVYNAMVAGVNKKFQDFSTERKTLLEQLEETQDQVATLDEGLTKWESFYTGNKDKIDRAIKVKDGDEVDGNRSRGRGRQVEGDERYDTLISSVNNYARNLNGELTKMGRMLSLSMQLNDIIRKHPEVDADKILDVANKKGYSNLNDAYKDEEAYGKEIFDKEVETRLKPRLQEELTKHMTNVETGSGAIPTTFEVPKELPASMTAAGNDFLKERAVEQSKL
jgi:hypothetical protein